MPKSRNSKHQQLDFQVSPWHTKKYLSTNPSTVGSPTGSDLAVELVTDLLFAGRTSLPSVHSHPAQSDPETSRRKLPAPNATPWIFKRPRTAEVPRPLLCAAGEVSVQLPHSEGAECRNDSNREHHASSTTAEHLEENLEQQEGLQVAGAAAASSSGASTLEGVAELAFLPNGKFSGHIVDVSSKLCLGVSGLELLSERDCFRDVEWSLAHVRLHNYHNGHELHAWLERTGGDLVQLRPAALEEEDIAEAIARCFEAADDAAEQGGTAVALTFAGSCLLSEGEAERHLAVHNPAASGKGAIVNTGLMRVEGVPNWFLD